MTIITRSTVPLHPDDRLSIWYMQRSTYRAASGVHVARPYRINLRLDKAGACSTWKARHAATPCKHGDSCKEGNACSGRGRGIYNLSRSSDRQQAPALIEFSMERSGVEVADTRTRKARALPTGNAASSSKSLTPDVTHRPTFHLFNRRPTLSFIGSVIGGALWFVLALWPLWV